MKSKLSLIILIIMFVISSITVGLLVFDILNTSLDSIYVGMEESDFKTF